MMFCVRVLRVLKGPAYMKQFLSQEIELTNQNASLRDRLSILAPDWLTSFLAIEKLHRVKTYLERAEIQNTSCDPMNFSKIGPTKRKLLVRIK